MRCALAAVIAAAATPTSAQAEKLQDFVTRPNLRAPKVRVETRTPAAARGKLFVAPKVGPGDAGPMILDERGRLVWFLDLPRQRKAFDFRVQTFEGRPVLTWWQGRIRSGHGLGKGVILDSSYRQIATVRAGNFGPTDLHEFVLTPRGTALVTVYERVPWDLSPVGLSPNGTALEGVVEEIDVRTGRLLWQWRSLDHVALPETLYAPPPRMRRGGFDHFHVNSIDVMPDGNLLLSARHTSALYKIDRTTGEVIWRLGGNRSDFEFEPGAAFSGQHDAHVLPDGTIALFDNGYPPGPDRPSRAIVLAVDEAARTARLVREYPHPTAPRSHTQGGAQPLPNGNVFVGWGGDSPWFSEYTNAGDLAFDARFAPQRTNTYRAYRHRWSGRPEEPPRAAAAARGRGRATVYASWNGATAVAAWEVLAGEAPDDLERVADATRTGFETEIDVRAAPWFAVRAIDRFGVPLARSRPAPLQDAAGGS
jgi:hypothetical protein